LKAYLTGAIIIADVDYDKSPIIVSLSAEIMKDGKLYLFYSDVGGNVYVVFYDKNGSIMAVPYDEGDWDYEIEDEDDGKTIAGKYRERLDRFEEYFWSDAKPLEEVLREFKERACKLIEKRAGLISAVRDIAQNNNFTFKT